MWIVMLTIRSEHLDRTACYGPYQDEHTASEAARGFNLVDWAASVHEVLPPPSREGAD